MDFLGGSLIESNTWCQPSKISLDETRDTSLILVLSFSLVVSLQRSLSENETSSSSTKGSYEVPSPVHIKHPHSMVPNMWVHPRHFTMVSGGCLILDTMGEGILSICVCKISQKQPLLEIFVALQRKPWTKPWRIHLFLCPFIEDLPVCACWCLWQASGPFSSTSRS